MITLTSQQTAGVAKVSNEPFFLFEAGDTVYYSSADDKTHFANTYTGGVPFTVSGIKRDAKGLAFCNVKITHAALLNFVYNNETTGIGAKVMYGYNGAADADIITYIVGTISGLSVDDDTVISFRLTNESNGLYALRAHIAPPVFNFLPSGNRDFHIGVNSRLLDSL